MREGAGTVEIVGGGAGTAIAVEEVDDADEEVVFLRRFEPTVFMAALLIRSGMMVVR